jgi:hypothetical protein
VRDDRQLFVSRKRARQFRASGHLPGRRPLPHLEVTQVCQVTLVVTTLTAADAKLIENCAEKRL